MKNSAILAVILLGTVLLSGAMARAEEHDQLTPLLVDLESWTAQAARGMSLVMPGMKMINANRQFRQGAKILDVTIVVNSGPGQSGDLTDFSLENDVNRTRTRQVGGFWVTSTHVKERDSGMIVVYLAHNQVNSSLLTVNYQQMTEDEALPILQMFDWANMRLVVAGLL